MNPETCSWEHHAKLSARKGGSSFLIPQTNRHYFLPFLSFWVAVGGFVIAAVVVVLVNVVGGACEDLPSDLGVVLQFLTSVLDPLIKVDYCCLVLDTFTFKPGINEFLFLLRTEIVLIDEPNELWIAEFTIAVYVEVIVYNSNR